MIAGLEAAGTGYQPNDGECRQARRTGHVAVEKRTQSAEQRLERVLALQDLLFAVSRDIGPALELQPVLETVLRAMRKLVDFRGGSICLVEDGMIHLAASDPPVTAEIGEARLPVGRGLAGAVVETGQRLYIPDIDADDRVIPVMRRAGSNAGMTSYAAVPLICLGETIGLLQIDSGELDAFNADDLDLLQGLGTQVAGAIESARRFEAVVKLDELKSDFLARVSHELRTPIAIISGFVESLMDEERPLSARVRKVFVGRIHQTTRRLRYLVEELLTLTSIESGLSPTTLIDTQLTQAVATLTESSRRNPRSSSRTTYSCARTRSCSGAFSRPWSTTPRSTVARRSASRRGARAPR